MKLNVAILEDNPIILNDYKQNLEKFQFVNVVACAKNSIEFLNNENTSKADALILDIDLGGESNMNGLEVAYRLRRPVLFVSAYNAEHLKEIEKLENDLDLIVDHITKPCLEENFLKKANKFLNEVLKSAKSKFVYLDFSDSKRNQISIDTIVFIETETGDSGASNNKRIYFTDRKPETLFNFTLSKIEDKGFDQSQFIKIRSSHRVNVEKIIRYCQNTHEIEVEIFKGVGKTEIKKLPVSENYRKDISRFKK